MLYLICKCSSSQVLQTQLVAQSHEERTELELSRHQVPVLCVVPCECNLKDHLHIIQILDSQSHTEDMFFLGGRILISFFLMFVRGNAEKRAEVEWPASLQSVFMLYKIIKQRMHHTYKWHLWLSPCHLQTGTSEGEASAHLSVSAHSFVASD